MPGLRICHHIEYGSGEGWYTTQGSQNVDQTLNEATTHSRRRRNRTLQPERHIQPHKCKHQRNPLLANKSNDGISKPDNHHSVPEPIAASAQPGAFPSKVRIQWPRGNQSLAWARLDQELSTSLTMRLKGSTAKQLSAFCEIVHSLCLEKFGEEVKRKRKSDGLKQPSRRQVQKVQLRKSPSFLSPSLPPPQPPTLTPLPPLSLPHPPTPPFPPIPRLYPSPQCHHPVAEAAGGARVWGTTGSCRNHLTNYGWRGWCLGNCGCMLYVSTNLLWRVTFP